MKSVLFLLFAASAAIAQQIALQPVANGLDKPVAITNAGDGRLFITLQRGEIVIWDGTSVLPQPFLDIRPLVLCCDERGLLSVAFHPRYRENGLFFVYYVDRNGDLNIARYRASSDPNRADANSAQILLTINHRQFGNHNGGQLQFGPDGFLYAGTGDGGGAGDPLGNGQNPASLLGKLLRIDVDAAVPQPQIRAIGLRNPWRFSFDRATGDLWIADVGQDTWEEIDFQPAGDPGGENYGWNVMEGNHCFQPGCNAAGLTLPIAEYDHSNGACSITGGYRYRGTRSIRMQGLYIFGDYCNGQISAIMERGSSWIVKPLLSTNLAISTFGEDVTGEIYVADYARGIVYRLVDESPPVPKRRSASH